VLEDLFDAIREALRRIGELFLDVLRRIYLEPVACQHFCLFKEAGSNFRNTHVHHLFSGPYPGNRNPCGYSGIGHDDETPGLSNPGDPKHNTVSRRKTARFITKEELRREFESECGDEFSGLDDDRSPAIAPIDVSAWSPIDGYFHPAELNPEGRCPPGYRRVRCDCGDMCITWDRDAYERWRASLPD
jgi:hypothetical protein